MKEAIIDVLKKHQTEWIRKGQNFCHWKCSCGKSGVVTSEESCEQETMMHVAGELENFVMSAIDKVVTAIAEANR